MLDQILLSIIILTKDKVDFLEKCISSICKVIDSTFEVIIVSNNSNEQGTFNFLKTLSGNIRYFSNNIDFNYSILNNEAVKCARGSFLLFLNNDTEAVKGCELEKMHFYASNPKTGAVGIKLLYPNNTIQHAGISIDKYGLWHPFQHVGKDEIEILNRNRACTAVTGACLMIEKNKFIEVGGFDENLRVAYNDVDLCLKLIEKGYRNLWVSSIELYHYEGVSRGKHSPIEDLNYFRLKWRHLLYEKDPFDCTTMLTIKHIEERVKRYVLPENREILIWGTGSSGERANYILNKAGITVSGFIDNNQEKWNTYHVGHIVFSPEVLGSLSKPYIIIASMYLPEISDQLIREGYNWDYDFYRVY